MSSIPLPALSVHAPDPMEGLQRVMTLRSLMQQQAMQPGQLELQKQAIASGAQEQQLRAQQIKDQQAMTQAMQQWDGKDLEQLPALALKNGASATAVMGLKKSNLEYRDKLAATSKAELENQAKTADAFMGHIDAIKGIDDPQQRAAAAQAQGQQILSAGLHKGLDPQTAQMIQGMAGGQFVPTDDQLSMFEKGLTSHQAAIEQELKKQQTAEAKAKGDEASAQAKKLQAEMEFYQRKGLAPGVPLDVQEASDWLAKNPGKGPADFMKYKASLVPQMNFNLQNAGATAPGAGGQPSPIAQAIASGEMKWSDAISPRTPMSVKAQMLAEVKKINPQFNSGDFAVEQKVKEAFTSGQYSQQLNSINRAREHMGTFLDLAKDLDGGNVKAFNRLSNAFSVEFGSDKVGNLNIAKQAFSAEVGKAFAGASVGVTDRQELDHQINAASSFQQLAGAAKTADKLLEGAQKALKQTYESGTKAQPNFGQNAPKATETRQYQGHTYEKQLDGTWKLTQ